MAKPVPLYGYYSQMEAELYGSHIWAKPDGEPVEVSCVRNEGVSVLWPDAINMGRVVQFLRPGKVINHDDRP